MHRLGDNLNVPNFTALGPVLCLEKRQLLSLHPLHESINLLRSNEGVIDCNPKPRILLARVAKLSARRAVEVQRDLGCRFVDEDAKRRLVEEHSQPKLGILHSHGRFLLLGNVSDRAQQTQRLALLIVIATA